MSLPSVTSFVRHWTPETWQKFRQAYAKAMARRSRVDVPFSFEGYRFIPSYAKLLIENHDWDLDLRERAYEIDVQCHHCGERRETIEPFGADTICCEVSL